MKKGSDDSLDELMASVLQSAHYRSVCPDAVRRIGAGELAKRRKWKDAVRETRSRLHQIAGAYLDSIPPYCRWIADLRAAPDTETLHGELRRMMRAHASTRERLPILETFYVQTLAPARPIRSVVDIACGLNPLALPWMDVEAGARYHACDLYSDMMDFVGAALEVPFLSLQAHISTESRDLVSGPPEIEADLALVLKFLPLLEQAGGISALNWLRKLKTRWALVSFPTKTLGGRNVGMASSYEARFRETLDQGGWVAHRFIFPGELCFLLRLRSANE